MHSWQRKWAWGAAMVSYRTGSGEPTAASNPSSLNSARVAYTVARLSSGTTRLAWA
jgi:hypothetical protein